jgi:hypothetical protein
MYAVPISPMRATCLSHLIHLDLFLLIMLSVARRFKRNPFIAISFTPHAGYKQNFVLNTPLANLQIIHDNFNEASVSGMLIT